jgi:VWFA-related protein
MQAAALGFLEALRPQDRVLVAFFDSGLHYGPGFTEDRAAVRAALTANGQGGQTMLYDSLAGILTDRLAQVSGRKALVLFTDGVDNESSRIDAKGTLALIETSDVVAYAVQYDTRRDFPPDRFAVPPPHGYAGFNALYGRAVRYLRDLTGRSGGRVYPADRIESLQAAFSEIAQELRLQYTLCYYPVNQKPDGSLRRIRVTVDRPGAKIRARPGYRAGSPERRSSGMP